MPQNEPELPIATLKVSASTSQDSFACFIANNYITFISQNLSIKGQRILKAFPNYKKKVHFFNAFSP